MSFLGPLRLLYVQVLLGMALGHLWPQAGALLKPVSDGFVGLVKMMIAPIVFCTIVSMRASSHRMRSRPMRAALSRSR